MLRLRVPTLTVGLGLGLALSLGLGAGCAPPLAPRTTATIAPPSTPLRTTEIRDPARDRNIPVTLYFDAVSHVTRRELVVISAGYRAKSDDYSFLARALTAEGYAVVGIQHDVPTDPPMATTGDLYTLRKPVWERGVKDIQFITANIRATYPNVRVEQLVLVGHSNGGDIGMLYATLYPDQIACAVTLDHRRMPVPRVSTPRILSIRADEFEADAGVLPSEDERARYGIRVVTLTNTRHADLSDLGSDATKKRITAAVLAFLQNQNSSHEPGQVLRSARASHTLSMDLTDKQ
jgi:pimeloyl-ACP methyl ester carboxylesterase